jgi:HD superfamily phosphohydrolase
MASNNLERRIRNASLRPRSETSHILIQADLLHDSVSLHIPISHILEMKVPSLENHAKFSTKRMGRRVKKVSVLGCTEMLNDAKLVELT